MKIFKFPKEWEIDKNIPKEIIYKVADADENLKRIFIENVERIRFSYLLNSKNTNIESCVVGEEKYEEINFLKVDLREKGKESTILRLMHQLIPKATVIILEFQSEYLISLADKKITENRVKIEELYNSLWIKEALKEFNSGNFNSGNLKLFYESIIERVRIYNLSQDLKIEGNIDVSNIEKLEALNKEIEELKALRKKETQMNRVAEIQNRLMEKIKEREKIKNGGIR